MTEKTHSIFFLLMTYFLADFQVYRKLHCFLHGKEWMKYMILHDVTAHVTKLLLISDTSINFNATSNITAWIIAWKDIK